MNLATTYLGLPLSSPFIVGASPFCDNVEVALRLQDEGAAALVMRSLFEEQIETARRRRGPARLAGTFGHPEFAEYQLSPDEYVRQLARLKRALKIPIIASLNGHHPGSWIDFAGRLERAGADAIELNFYQVVTDPAVEADHVETEMLEIVGAISRSVRIPVAAK